MQPTRTKLRQQQADESIPTHPLALLELADQAQLRAEILKSNPNPRYVHDCDRCTFLGRWREYDLYFCPQTGIPTVLARYSDMGQDYTSGMGSDVPPLVEAKRRAVAVGLLGNEPVTAQAIANVTAQIANERIDWQKICEQHDPQSESDQQCESLRNGTARYSTLREDVIVLGVLAVICAALIGAVVHFALIIDAWTIPAWVKVLSIGVMVALIVASRIIRHKKGI
jgi:hypothetical protein